MCWPITCWDPLVGNLFRLFLATNKSESVVKSYGTFSPLQSLDFQFTDTYISIVSYNVSDNNPIGTNITWIVNINHTHIQQINNPHQFFIFHSFTESIRIFKTRGFKSSVILYHVISKLLMMFQRTVVPSPCGSSSPKTVIRGHT